MKRKSVKRGGLALAALLVLASCAELTPDPTEKDSTVAPQRTARSEKSEELARHFARLEADFLARGLLRTDGGGPDVPFTDTTLTENFIKIALYDEYVSAGGRLIARETPSRLRRWEQPVRMSVEFGETVPQKQRAKDRGDVSKYAARLSRATGLPIRMSQEQPNFIVSILNENERLEYGPRLRELVPGISDAAVRQIIEMPRTTLCAVFAFSRGASNTSYSKAIAIIRGEHPDLLRLSCIHEELAQGLGLANDSPAARPSVFNDDEEFALLTRHDELLLKILYDERLKTGMTPEQARPIIKQIATELIGGES